MAGSRARVFIVALLYAECSAKLYQFNDTIYLGEGGPRPVNNGPVPSFYDWREQKMVSAVKNQQFCNACWAFSAVAAIESHVKIYLGKEVVLSEQFLIDCDKGNAGCDSASMLETYANIVTHFGGVLNTSDYYPYEGARKRCRWSKRSKPEAVIGFKRVFPDEDEMVKYVYHYGPLSAAINSASMGNYTNGIDEPTFEACSPENLNHIVLIVGYNVYVSEDGKQRVPYWIIKNSWGEDWGDGGFYYLVRGRNACGITSDVSFPFVK